MKKLSRRHVLLGGCVSAAVLLQPRDSVAVTKTYGEGDWDMVANVFIWNNIGGDPLRIAYRAALMQERIADQVPPYVLEALLAQLETARKGPTNHVIRHDDRSNLMLSGNGWIAQNVVADVAKWRTHVSRDAWVVYYKDRSDGRQYRLILAKGCNNLLLDRFDAPIICRCEPQKGDACF